jgi:DNA processing protein
VSSACDACLRRGHLIGHLAARIAGLLDRPADRAPALLALSDEELIAASTAARGREGAREFLERFDAGEARERLEAAGLGAVCPHGAAYPPGLRHLTDQPAALFHTGSPEALARVAGERSVAIVGARQASAYGLEVAASLGRSLGAAGIPVVSGLALGIDAAAHRGCLEGSGVPVAVMAGGPDVAYPRTNAGVHRDVRERGVVVSELPPGRRPLRWSFPARNRIMAALSEMTLVVEAREASGSLITATFATQLGRALGAVPGRITDARCAGSNALIRDGAMAVLGAGQVLEELFGVGIGEAMLRRRPARRLDAVQRRLLEGVEAGLGVPGIVEHAGVPVREARAGLARLETAGYVRRVRLGAYERTLEPR